jgi:acetyltransferase-like isoleucine patch superfamily enzyme
MADYPNNKHVYYSFINHNCYFEGMGQVIISDSCQVRPSVTFLTSDHDITNKMNTEVKNITIKENVFIGGGLNY